MAGRDYPGGLQGVGDGVYAYLQPDGGWGLSNAGLVVDAGESLLVDTLIDLRRTGGMLEAMRRAEGAASTIDVLVNTHANGDHCWGNELVEGAEVIASDPCVQEMRERPPEAYAALLKRAPELGRLGLFLQRIFGGYEFDDIRLRVPNRTFAGELAVRVGARELRLIEVGPAHTRGDVLVHVPDARVVFAGDIVMAGTHPLVWAGPVANYLRALDRIVALDVDVVVPGHGPVGDTSAALRLKAFLEHLSAEVRKRVEAGLSVIECARDIDLEDYADWGQPERIVVNVAALYRELSPGGAPGDVPSLFALMAELAR